MTTMENWLSQATRCLSAESRARVRSEILDHYETSRDAAVASGAMLDEAEAMALRSLGDAAEANRLYRQSLLTSREAKLLKEGNWEARAVCARPVLKRLAVALPSAVFLAGAIALFNGANGLASTLLSISVCFSVLVHGPFLPIYTPLRSRIYRGFKWAALLGLFLIAAEISGWRNSWLSFSCLSPIVWTEWIRFSIRRKLPVSRWPRQLHL